MNGTAPALDVCDDALMETIVEGRFSDAGKAIGQANLPTLQRAAQRCAERFVEALALAHPCQRYADRKLLCRQRITRLTKKPNSF